MGIPAFIKRSLNQTLVYWANPANDGYGAETYDTPVEISGRCEHKTELVVSESGEEVLSKAQVWLEQVVKEGEYLYLGTLSDSGLDSAPVPKEVSESMRVLAFSKVPVLGRADEFEYKAYLNIE